MKRTITGLFFGALLCAAAHAQTQWPTPSGPSAAPGVVDMCLNSSGQAVPITSGQCNGTLPVSGTFTASLGGFTPSASGARATPLAVTTSDGNSALPTGTVVAVTNVGSNPMYCNVNAVAATTADQLITSGGGWFAFTIPSGVTVLHCISTGGSTTANMVGGSGLPTGTGGGGGGGGSSGAVFGPTAVGSAAANPPVLTGGTADGTATGNVAVWKIVSGIGYLNVAQVNGVTTLAGAGAVGTGSQRVAVGQDTTTIAGSAPGTAGTPSSQVISVQGVSGGTAQPVSAASGAYASGSLAAGSGTDGWNVTEGTKGDSAANNPTSSWSIVAILKGLYALITTGNASLATIATNTGAAVPAGTNNIGTIGSIGSQYPTGAVPITASATGTIAATTATLAATTGKTTYICSSSVRANATAATTVTDTITGVITATISSLLWVAPAASGVGIDEQIFSPCVPASATNTAIAVISGTPGSGGAVTVHATGYQL